MLGAIFGGALMGVGLGLILRGGATTGGTDMLAKMVHQKLPFISTGMFLMIIDCVVVILPPSASARPKRCLRWYVFSSTAK